ncbi:hypothetical protein BU17DRAFT_80924 [Hysterangium stoloniferum]|nr:hypothetical protein BU17DRAFT_80924 [Hysterangium stoloniferum]
MPEPHPCHDEDASNQAAFYALISHLGGIDLVNGSFCQNPSTHGREIGNTQFEMATDSSSVTGSSIIPSTSHSSTIVDNSWNAQRFSTDAINEPTSTWRTTHYDQSASDHIQSEEFNHWGEGNFHFVTGDRDCGFGNIAGGVVQIRDSENQPHKIEAINDLCPTPEYHNLLISGVSKSVPAPFRPQNGSVALNGI